MHDMRISLSQEEYQSLLGSKIKLDILDRHFSRPENNAMYRSDFETITGFEHTNYNPKAFDPSNEELPYV